MTTILEEAQEIIFGARNASYGHPRDNFQNIADVWNGYLARYKTELTPMDVANLMILMKVARLNGTGYHRDSVTDIAGYAGTIERLQEPVDPIEVRVEPDLDAFAETLKATLDQMSQEARLPRQWDSLADVPRDVRVRSAGGEIWKFWLPGEVNEDVNFAPVAEHNPCGEWLWSPKHSPKNRSSVLYKTGPFTEVLEPRKFNYLNADIPADVNVVQDQDGEVWRRWSHPESEDTWHCDNGDKSANSPIPMAWGDPPYFTEVVDG